MKTKTLNILASLLALAAVSCEIEKEQFQQPETTGSEATAYYRIKAGHDISDPVTRTALIGGEGADRNNVTFVKGDRLLVCYGDKGAEEEYGTTGFEMTGDPAADGSADFGGNISETASEIFAVYPYSEDFQFSITRMKNELYASIKPVQTPVAGSYDPDAVLSFGNASVPSEGSIPMNMLNINALVKFAVPEGKTIKKAVLKSNAEEAICGELTAAFYHPGAENVIGNINPGVDTEDSVVLKGADMTSGNWYYFSVIPQVLEKGFEIELYETADAYDPIFSRSTDQTIELQRNKILNIGVLPPSKEGEWLGSGTPNDPYQISSLDQLLLLQERFANPKNSQMYFDKYFVQTSDIDCKGMEISIGSFSTESGPEHEYAAQGYTDWDDRYYQFSGTYDGNGHTISNYKLKSQIPNDLSKRYYVGLFCNTFQATFRNLTLKPAVLDDLGTIYTLKDKNTTCYVGALIGYAGTVNKFQEDGDKRPRTIIENCHIDGVSYKVQLSTEGAIVDRYSTGFFGGLIGRCAGSVTMTGCSNNAYLILSGGDEDALSTNDDNSYLGGFIGSVEKTFSDFWGHLYTHVAIDKCRNNGDLTAYSNHTDPVAGGFIGLVASSNLELHISNSVNSGFITTFADGSDDDAYSGGFIGYCTDIPDSWIRNCLNRGGIYAYGDDASAGGFIGKNNGGDITMAVCANIGNISAENDPHVGAFCGMNDDAECVGCYWLDEKDCKDGGNAAIPYIYDEEKTSSSDDYRFFKPLISCSDLNALIDNTPSAIKGGWADTEWPSKAVRWTGSATYGTLGNSLDLDFQL